METLISSRLFGHFAETFREGKTITENKVTDAYGEFISQLSLLANGYWNWNLISTETYRDTVLSI